MDNNKSQSRLNAVRHGLLSKSVILDQDDVRPFNKLVKKLMTELEPQTALEVLLAEQIVIHYWRMRRFLKLENEVFLFSGSTKYDYDKRNFIELFTDFVKSNPSFDLLSRYNSNILRSFYRAIHEYRNMKVARMSGIEAEKSG